MHMEELSEIIAQTIEEVLKKGRGQDVVPADKEKALIIVETGADIDRFFKERSELLIGYSVDIFIEGTIENTDMFKNYGRLIGIGEINGNKVNGRISYDMVVCPRISIKYISKIAHVIIDDPVTQVIFDVLSTGKKVYINNYKEDSAYGSMPEPLKKEISCLIDKITGFGIKIMNRELVKGQSVSIRPGCRRIITLSDVIDSMHLTNELVMGDNDILTSLALDYVRDNGIKVRK